MKTRSLLLSLLLCAVAACNDPDPPPAPPAPQAPPGAPRSPQRLGGAWIPEGFRMQWVDESDNEDGFRVQRSIGGAEWNAIGAVGPDETLMVDRPSEPVGTVLRYRVVAFNQAGESLPSEEIATRIGAGGGGGPPSGGGCSLVVADPSLRSPEDPAELWLFDSSWSLVDRTGLPARAEAAVLDDGTGGRVRVASRRSAADGDVTIELELELEPIGPERDGARQDLCLALPFALGSIGLPGCRLVVSIEAASAMPPPAGGSSRLILPVPVDPGLLGVTLHEQAIVLDPAAPGGALLSDGVRATLGGL